MSGGDLKRKTAYTSKPDILKTEIQHQVLALEADSKLDVNHEFGIK